MSKNILLVDADNFHKSFKTYKFPNLALMKISAYHKGRGDIVGFNVSDPDIIYASCVFTWNRCHLGGLKYLYPNAEINMGGSGIDLKAHLPIPDGDLITPDYDLYPGLDYDVGFTSRGCIRSCYFCIVPEKEGSFKSIQHPKSFHDPKHKKAVYLDNNILASKEWFFEVTDWTIENNIAVDFCQGLDIRLMDEEIASRIAETKHFKPWKFAYDSSTVSGSVKRGLEILNDAGVKTRNDAICYVYVHDDSQVEDALERCNNLKEWKCTPFVMLNALTKRTQRMTDLKRWCRPWLFWSCDYEDYTKKG